jgi:hypothetical protein
MADKFDKPVNTWIEEEVDVKVISPSFDHKTKQVTLNEEVKKAKQRTYYSDSPANVVVCSHHKYKMIDRGKYLFKCINCSWHRIAPPVTYKYNPETMELRRRDTNERV